MNDEFYDAIGNLKEWVFQNYFVIEVKNVKEPEENEVNEAAGRLFDKLTDIITTIGTLENEYAKIVADNEKLEGMMKNMVASEKQNNNPNPKKK